MRIFATGDLHADFADNWAVIRQLSRTEYLADTLLVAGDIAHRLGVIEATLLELKRRFKEVCYLPGNHECWMLGETGSSVKKFNRILRLAEALGVHTRPLRCPKGWVVPLFSWYEAAFACDDPEEYGSPTRWGDFRYCKWPAEVTSPAEFFLALNAPNIRSYDGPVLSFSHFVPRRELLPAVDNLRFKGLPWVAGSNTIEQQVRALGAQVHVFGHSHIHCDQWIEGVRYVQHGLGYPKERGRRDFVLKQIC